LAIETSGHAAFKDNFYLDDGAYLATRIVILMAALRKEGKSIEDILKNLKMPAEEKEVRIKIDEEDFAKYGNIVLEDFKKLLDDAKGIERVKMNFEGVKANFDKQKGDGWLLLRLSLHEPLLVANCESNSVGGTEKMLETLKAFLSNYKKLKLNF